MRINKTALEACTHIEASNGPNQTDNSYNLVYFAGFLSVPINCRTLLFAAGFFSSMGQAVKES